MISAPLSADQKSALEEALRWEDEALARLGALELQRRAAELRADEAAKVAREASMQASNVLRLLCSMLKLEPGEWRYDRATGQLTKREVPDAESP